MRRQGVFLVQQFHGRRLAFAPVRFEGFTQFQNTAPQGVLGHEPYDQYCIFGIMDPITQMVRTPVVNLRVFPKNFGELGGQRTVDVNGQARHLALIVKLMQDIEQFLRTTESERGDQDGPPTFDGVLHHRLQPRF